MGLWGIGIIEVWSIGVIVLWSGGVWSIGVMGLLRYMLFRWILW